MKKDEINFSRETFILKSDETIAKKYLKIKEISNGTYAKVYIVQKKTDFKLYCCKEILKSKVADLPKFRNEINILSKVDHPNIIRLFEIFEDNRYISLIMELCEGGNLFEKINELAEKDKSFSEKEAVKMKNFFNFFLSFIIISTIETSNRFRKRTRISHQIKS